MVFCVALGAVARTLSQLSYPHCMANACLCGEDVAVTRIGLWTLTNPLAASRGMPAHARAEPGTNGR